MCDSCFIEIFFLCEDSERHLFIIDSRKESRSGGSVLRAFQL